MTWIKNNKMMLVLLLLVLTTFGISIKNWNDARRIKYVDTLTLFSEFQFTKELEAKEAPILSLYKSKLDSVHQIYELLKSDLEREKLGRFIYQFENEAKQYQENSNKKINDMVWARLNKLIDQYGKEHQFNLLFGANGMGTILYGDSSKDETKNLITYCDKQYKNER
jgi:outer membrane protein